MVADDPTEESTWELTGVVPSAAGVLFDAETLRGIISVAAQIPYGATPQPGVETLRQLLAARTIYLKEALSVPLAFGEIASHALPYNTYRLAFTAGMLTSAFAGEINAGILAAKTDTSRSKGSVGLPPVASSTIPCASFSLYKQPIPSGVCTSSRTTPTASCPVSPIFDSTDLFDPRRVRFADIDGTGPSDVLYGGSEGVSFWLNQSGNGWGERQQLHSVPRVDSHTRMSVVDLLDPAPIWWTTPPYRPEMG